MEEIIMKASTWVIIALVFLVIVLGVGVFFMGYYKDNDYTIKDLKEEVEELQTNNNQTEPASINPAAATTTSIEESTPAESTEQSEEPAPAEESAETNTGAVVKWTPEAPTNYLPSYCYTVGDDIVEGQIVYDEGGQGQTTIIINLSGKPVEVYGKWGSGDAIPISQNIDLQMQVNDITNSQWGQVNSAGEYVWDEVRVVIADKNGEIHDLPVLTEKWSTINISEFIAG